MLGVPGSWSTVSDMDEIGIVIRLGTIDMQLGEYRSVKEICEKSGYEGPWGLVNARLHPRSQRVTETVHGYDDTIVPVRLPDRLHGGFGVVKIGPV